MTWINGIELIVGVGALTLAVFLVGVFRFVPLPGDVGKTPSQMRLTVIPMIILLTAVCGFSLLLRSFGLL